MEKRGQVYLLAALIIAGFILSLGTVFNYARASAEDENLVDLSKEIDFEISRVIDRGVFRNSDESELQAQIEALAGFYAQKVIDPREEMAVIFGDAGGITAYHYKLDSVGTNCINTGGGCSGITSFTKVREEVYNLEVAGDIIRVTLEAGGPVYEFDLKEGENFYIIAIKNKENERFISSPELKK